MSSSSSCLVAAVTRSGTRPLSHTALFPSANINLTPISLRASESRPISARAAASSRSGRRPGRTPGLDAASASCAPCRATERNFIPAERSTPARSAASLIVYSPRINAIQDLSLGDKNRLPRRRLGPVPSDSTEQAPGKRRISTAPAHVLALRTCRRRPEL